MKKSAAIIGAAMAGIMSLSLTACGPKTPTGYTPITYICSGLTNSTKTIFRDMVNAYNNTQGNEDKVFVTAQYLTTEEYGQYASDLNKKPSYAVATVRDSQIRNLMTVTAKSGFLNLDTVMTQELQTELDGMPKELVNRFRVNSTQNADGKYEVGEGANLLGVPIGSKPHVLYYNTDMFAENKINVISVAEDKISSYNTANGGKLVAHGYAEYKENPLPSANPALEKSKNEKGDDVYKVFNNRIAMSWEEQRLLARYLQKSYTYGYMSEWWFNYLWSVGADCMVWNETTKSYELSLAHTYSGYLAMDTVTVNGNTYSQGDVLYPEDAFYLSENASALSDAQNKLHALPSAYDAFLEFNKLGIPTSKPDKNQDGTDAGYKGYGVAPSTTSDRTKWFVNGKECPFLIESFELGIESFNNTAVKNKWDIAPACQYRLYENKGVYYSGTESFANEYLMVIGEKYDLNGDGKVGSDEIYTGEVQTTSNGTPIVGEVGAASVGYALCIPAKVSEAEQQAALKFITWVAGAEGQKYIGKTNTLVPSDIGYALSDELANDNARVSNIYAAALTTTHADVGDYTYFNSRTWIDNWSGYINGEVRRGDRTIKDFIDAKLKGANSDLKTMNLRIKGR